MNAFLKNFGIILIIIGIAVLGYYAIENPVSNAALAFASLLLVSGLVVHIVINRIID